MTLKKRKMLKHRTLFDINDLLSKVILQILLEIISKLISMLLSGGGNYLETTILLMYTHIQLCYIC